MYLLLAKIEALSMKVVKTIKHYSTSVVLRVSINLQSTCYIAVPSIIAVTVSNL